jgi:adenosylcobinamide-GDP ribazoletransferase
MNHQLNWILIIIPVIARSQLALLLVTTPYAKPTGMGINMQQHAPKRAIWGEQWLILLILIILTDPVLMLVILISFAMLIFYRKHLVDRLQGTTGDTAGAWVEIRETMILILSISFGAFF